MSSRIDGVGAYRGEIIEAGLGTTKKSGFPQWVVRFRATEKFIEDPSDLKHFEMDEPGWVDWSEYGDELTGFFVLFNSTEEFSEDTSLLNYEQIQLAVGCDGTEFDSLNNGKYVGKKVLFRVDLNEYDGKESFQINWIDAEDASPVRELKKLNPEDVKALTAKLKFQKKQKPSVAKPSAAKPTTKKSEAKAPTESAPPSKAKVSTTEKPADKTPDETSSLPTECSQEKAWAFVCKQKGGNTDKDIEEAWIAAANEVGEDKDEDDFTEADWAKVRDIVIRDLALDV